jgi:hypothetical protein
MNQREFNIFCIQAVKRDADPLIRNHRHLRIIEWINLRAPALQFEPWDNPMNKINSVCGIFSNVNWLMAHSQPLFKRAVMRSLKKLKTLEGSGAFPNYEDFFNEIDNAAKDLSLEGYEHRNVRDKLKFVLYPFIENNMILNCRQGFTIEDFYSKEDIILNIMDEKSDYVIGTVIANILIDLQRYYEIHTIQVFPPDNGSPPSEPGKTHRIL